MRRIIPLLLAMVLLAGCAVNPTPSDSTVQTTAGATDVPGACTHADADDNGSCDGCGISVMTTFDIYAINDLHGKVADGDTHPGVDELSTYLECARIVDDNVIILSVGDMWQGSPESNLTHGILMTDWMNEMGFVSMTLGNHEFDWGTEHIEANAEFAQFPFLAINIYDRETDQPVEYCQASVVVEGDGLQIGIIGAIGDCYSSIASDKVQDVYFKTGSELTALVMEESERLRGEGVDFIIYAIHDGFGQNKSTEESKVTSGQIASYYDTALSDGYVDLVFEGHTHKQYLLLDGSGVYHLQNKGDNSGGISHVEIAINTITGTHSIQIAELVSTDVYAGYADHALIDELLVKYGDQIDKASEVIGINGDYRSGDEIRQIVADLYYQLGEAVWADEYDIVLGGGFLSVRSPYYLAAGEVTYGDLQSILPFDNDLVLCSVLGSDLLNRFINTGNGNYFICCDEEFRVEDLNPDGIYYIVVDDYTSSYAPNRLTVVEEYELGVYARDLLADYIAAGGLE